MEKFIPYEKLSKKEKRKIDQAKRHTWGELNPVTRKPENSKAYNRRRAQAWKKELPSLRSLYLLASCTFHHMINSVPGNQDLCNQHGIPNAVCPSDHGKQQDHATADHGTSCK